MNRDKLINLLLAILLINLGLMIIVERNLAGDRLEQFFYVFLALPFLAGVAILSINRFSVLPQLVEGQWPKVKKEKYQYRQAAINIVVWLGLALAAALIFFLVWLNLSSNF